MHGKRRSAIAIFEPSLQPRNAVLAILLLLLFLIFVLMTAAMQARAQTTVPPTARQAATMPQFASRLHSAATASRRPQVYAPQASFRNPKAMLPRGWLPEDNFTYSNGPINGTTDAWTINNGFVTSNSFTVPSGASLINGLTFGAWAFPGDVLQTVEVSITSSEFGGTTYYDGAVNFTQSGCSGNQFGFNVCTESADYSFTVNLAGGTYWVNLSNAVVNDGDPIYWDENSGVGCDSPGCPSAASQNSVGTIPSEAFSVLGNETCAAPTIANEEPIPQAKAATRVSSPAQTFRVIYNFTGGADGGGPTNALLIDAAGNLYGTTPGGGLVGAGTVFKLMPKASGWTYTRLYSFSGADGSDPDSPLALASNGHLYGTAGGGASGDGVLFGLSPPANAVSPSPFSNWTKSLLYNFTGGSDGAKPGGGIVLDTSGNIYGTASQGGANGGGTVYEFTNGGLQVQHAFPAFPGDGENPLGLVSGAGGLYGLTFGGGAYQTGTLYTLAGGYNVLLSFSFPSGQGWPVDLAADQGGNLYVADTSGTLVNGCYYIFSGAISKLTYPDWTQETLVSWGNLANPLTAWVTPDTSGNVYGTVILGYSLGEVFKLTCCWNYTTLHQFIGSDGAGPFGGVVIDAQGNIYGATASGGAYGKGVVWEISP
jgi:uncharacterized repeat protein (TIGR03803 family)